MIPYKKYTTMNIVHCLVWPSVSALFFITCAFLVYYDPCHLRTGKQKTNLRRVSARILNKGNSRHKTTSNPDDIEALRPITHPVQQTKEQRKHRKPQSKLKGSINDKDSLLPDNNGHQIRIVVTDRETDRNNMKKNRHPHGSDGVIPRKTHHRRRKPHVHHGCSDGSSESGKRQKMTSSSETSENTEKKRVKTRHKRTASEPARTPSFLRETNL